MTFTETSKNHNFSLFLFEEYLICQLFVIKPSRQIVKHYLALTDQTIPPEIKHFISTVEELYHYISNRKNRELNLATGEISILYCTGKTRKKIVIRLCGAENMCEMKPEQKKINEGEEKGKRERESLNQEEVSEEILEKYFEAKEQMLKKKEKKEEEKEEVPFCEKSEEYLPENNILNLFNPESPFFSYFLGHNDIITFKNKGSESTSWSKWTHLRSKEPIKNNTLFKIQFMEKNMSCIYGGYEGKNGIAFGIINQASSIEDRSFLSSSEAIYLNLCARTVQKGEQKIKDNIQCLERFMQTEDKLTMEVSIKKGYIIWKLNGVLCGQTHFKFTELNQDFVPFLEFCQVGLRIKWKTKNI